MLLGRSATHLILLRDSGHPVFVPSSEILEVRSRESLPDFLIRMHASARKADSDETAAITDSDDADHDGP
jgi:hypothetical protein